MKTEIGKPDYKFSGGVKSAASRGQRKPLPLRVIPYNEMEEHHRQWPNMRGIPVCIAFDAKKSMLWFFPAPQGIFEIDLERGHSIDPPKDSIVGTITKQMLKA